MATKPIWPNGRFGVPQITPYTSRDAHSLLELIKALRDHVVDELHPNLQKAMEQLVVDVEAEYGKSLNRYVAGVQEFQTIHDRFMSDVNAHLVALNDGAVTDLVEDATSLLGKVLREVFTDREAFTTLETGITTQVNSFLVDADTKFQHDQSPYAFGAIGDGIADDTDAIEAWLQAGAHDFVHGIYRISRTLTIEQDDYSIIGINNPVIVLSGAHRFLTIRGDRAHVEGFTVTGMDPTSGQIRGTGAVYVYGKHTVVRHMTVKHLHDMATARAFHIEGPGGTKFQNNHIENLTADGDGITGGGYGMSRAVTLYNPNPATIPSVIENNTISGIWGEEGDAISVAFDLGFDGGVAKDGTITYMPGLTTIQNNRIDGVSRRYIKLQASQCDIIQNTCVDTYNRTPDHPSNAISLVRVDDVRILGNIIDWNNLNQGIQLYSSGIVCNNIVVDGNQVCVQNGHDGIFLSTVAYSSVTNNTIFNRKNNRRSVSVSGKDTVISGNVSRGSNSQTTSVRAYQVDAISDRVYMTNNTDIRTPPLYWQFDNRSRGGITEGNIGIPGGD